MLAMLGLTDRRSGGTCSCHQGVSPELRPSPCAAPLLGDPLRLAGGGSTPRSGAVGRDRVRSAARMLRDLRKVRWRSGGSREDAKVEFGVQTLSVWHAMRDGGRFVVYSEWAPRSVRINECVAPFAFDAASGRLEVKCQRVRSITDHDRAVGASTRVVALGGVRCSAVQLRSAHS